MKRVPSAIRHFATVFREHGHELFVVGGAVRDRLLGRPVSDYDFATSATPQEVRDLFRRTIPTGIAHGTVTVLHSGRSLEVTTYRVDGDYSDHRRPDEVTFTRSLHEDLARRDFTINAIALDPSDGSLHDPFNGRADLREGVVRCVGEPARRFEEDALRMLRALRFACVLEFRVDSATWSALCSHSAGITDVASERIMTELGKIMAARRPSIGLRLMHDSGLLAAIMPELEEYRAAAEREPGLASLFEHLIRTTDCAPAEPPALRWAALLHDIAKPRCMAYDERGLHFHGHDERGAEMARAILERLRAPRALTETTAHLVRHHMFGIDGAASDAALRRFIARVTAERVLQLTALRRADICGKGGSTARPELARLEQRLERMLSEQPALGVQDLAVNGKDLIARLERPPGPWVGLVLNELLQTVLDDPETNSRDQLLEIATRFVRERMDKDQ